MRPIRSPFNKSSFGFSFITNTLELRRIPHFLNQVRNLSQPITGKNLAKAQQYTRVCERAFQSSRSDDFRLKVSELGAQLAGLTGDTRSQKMFDHSRLVLAADTLVKRYAQVRSRRQDTQAIGAAIDAFLTGLRKVPPDHVPTTLPDFSAILRQINNSF